MKMPTVTDAYFFFLRFVLYTVCEIFLSVYSQLCLIVIISTSRYVVWCLVQKHSFNSTNLYIYIPVFSVV